MAILRWLVVTFLSTSDNEDNVIIREGVEYADD